MLETQLQWIECVCRLARSKCRINMTSFFVLAYGTYYLRHLINNIGHEMKCFLLRFMLFLYSTISVRSRNIHYHFKTILRFLEFPWNIMIYIFSLFSIIVVKILISVIWAFFTPEKKRFIFSIRVDSFLWHPWLLKKLFG